MRMLLLPFSWIYGVAVSIRNILFDVGILTRTSVGVPVISVGNMTAGGTGKTPLAERIVEYLLQRGERVAVVSRGYGRRSRGVVVVSDGRSVKVNADEGGDEPVQIARKYPGVSVVVGERRVDAARLAVKDLGASVIVLDDGFQHRYLKRNLDIVVVDARRDLHDEPMLPAGARREPLSGLRRADLVALSKVEFDNLDWSVSVRRWFDGPVVAFRHAITSVHKAADHREVTPSEYRGKAAIAFSGIGDHGNFVTGLWHEGFRVVGEVQFRDHHRYAVSDIDRLMTLYKSSGAEVVVTTEKDLARLQVEGAVKSAIESMPLFYVRVTVELVSGGDELFSQISSHLTGEASS
jgi:tetraacyldisaccharide 4'-kinase